MDVSLSPFEPENLVSRDGFGSTVPRQFSKLHIEAEYGTYLREDRSGVYLLIEIPTRHRASSEFIGSRNCVPMAFIPESPPTQRQPTSR